MCIFSVMMLTVLNPLDQTNMNKSNHGGRRKGAGRPVTGDARIKTSITLRPDDKNWLSKQKQKTSELIDLALKLLRKHIVR